MAFSPNNKLLATANLHDSPFELWELPSGKKITTLDGHTNDSAGSLMFSPDGNILACGGDKGIICLWDIKSLYKSE